MCLAARAGKPEKAHIHLITLDEDVDRTMAQLRDTIWALHGEAITLDELGNQVERFLDRQTQYRDRPEVSVTFPPDAEDTLSPMQALHLVRIIQEGVNNALKHANASTLAVRVRHVSPMPSTSSVATTATVCLRVRRHLKTIMASQLFTSVPPK